MISAAGEDVAGLQRHVSAIATFLRQYEWLWRAHVVDFFQTRLWEIVEQEWNNSLRLVSIEDLLLLPSGAVPEHCPGSLKEFVRTAFQLSLSREQVMRPSLMSHSGIPQASISSVLGQGMSVKKLHEIEILAALIASTAQSRGAKDVIDVGAGQGSLALVLAFEYRLSVIAVDACAHHADVTNKRAIRIQKYYNARSRKSQQPQEGSKDVRAPQTVTCRVGTGDSPAPLASLLPAAIHEVESNEKAVVLAGLHACGDLSATMLRAFVECKEVAAVINVGCCYNLLTDDESSNNNELHGFPMSATVARLGLHLGRSARDLACQSADRWKEHHPTRAIQNFELHAFRAAFQLILERFYPETAMNSPSVGRAGKSRRRRHARQSAMEPVLGDDAPSNEAKTKQNGAQALDGHGEVDFDLEQQASRFEEYARLALERLSLPPVSAPALNSAWIEVAPHQDLVGPFYALRAVLAPVIESYILLDRLLYVKEQAEVVASSNSFIIAELVPLFEPSISPRNMAIVAHRTFHKQ